MDWWNCKQTRKPVRAKTVADLIAILQTCPQDYDIRNSDEGEFCEIIIATDGVENIVELY